MEWYLAIVLLEGEFQHMNPEWERAPHQYLAKWLFRDRLTLNYYIISTLPNDKNAARDDHKLIWLRE